MTRHGWVVCTSCQDLEDEKWERYLKDKDEDDTNREQYLAEQKALNEEEDRIWADVYAQEDLEREDNEDGDWTDFGNRGGTTFCF